MVKVIKRDKSLEGFKASKIVKACKGAGVPEPIAKTIATMVSRKVKNRKTISSTQIKKMVLDILTKVGKAPAKWRSYKKPKKKTAKRKTARKKTKRRK